jgi:hypothetical protein
MSNQECLAQISKRQIVDRINESEFYAIMIDESTDISVQVIITHRHTGSSFFQLS